jgi:hypothetical protein
MEIHTHATLQTLAFGLVGEICACEAWEASADAQPPSPSLGAAPGYHLTPLLGHR